MTVAGAMLEFDSSREVLIEHTRGQHLVKSAWFMVIAPAVFINAPAQASPATQAWSLRERFRCLKCKRRPPKRMWIEKWRD